MHIDNTAFQFETLLANEDFPANDKNKPNLELVKNLDAPAALKATKEDMRLSLLEMIDEQEAEQLGLNKSENWEITDLERANYVSDKVARLKAENAEKKLIAQKELEQRTNLVNAWLDRETNANNYKIAYYESLLQEFADKKIKERADGKQSVNLFNSVLQFTTTKEMDYSDEDAIVQFCLDNKLECIKQVKELKKTEFKKLCSKDVGKVYVGDKEVPGVTRVANTTFSIRQVK